MKYEYRIIFDAESDEDAANICEVMAYAIMENKTRELNSELVVTVPENIMAALTVYKIEEE